MDYMGLLKDLGSIFLAGLKGIVTFIALCAFVFGPVVLLYAYDITGSLLLLILGVVSAIIIYTFLIGVILKEARGDFK